MADRDNRRTPPMLPDEVREAVDALYQRANESGVFFYMPTNAEARDTIRAHLLAREAEVERHVKMLADCFRMAGADTDGNEDWRIAPDALRAVTDLRRDYDDVLDWQDRAERAEALLRECRLMLPAHCGALEASITAHLSENSRG